MNGILGLLGCRMKQFLGFVGCEVMHFVLLLVHQINSTLLPWLGKGECASGLNFTLNLLIPSFTQAPWAYQLGKSL